METRYPLVNTIQSSVFGNFYALKVCHEFAQITLFFSSLSYINRLKPSAQAKYIDLDQVENPQDGSHRKEAFFCAQCNYSCNKAGALRVHMRTHSGKKPYS